MTSTQPSTAAVQLSARNDFTRALQQAARLLRSGGVIIYPTETFYALGALASDAQAVMRLAQIKGRLDAVGKPLPLIVGSPQAAQDLGQIPPALQQLAHRYWPGPLTVAVRPHAPLPSPVLSATGTVGIRVSAHAFARQLAELAGGALVATSANLTGQEPVASLRALSPQLLAQVDGVVDGGTLPGQSPSTVVAQEGAEVVVIREGAIPKTAIFQVLSSACA